MAAPQTLSECCISGHLHEGTPEGSITKIAGLDAYEVWPASRSKAKTILYLSDIFGWELNNARLLADEFAKAGFYVIVPDFFKGDPIPEAHLNTIVPRKPHELSDEQKTKTAAEGGALLGPWTVKHLEADPPLFAAALKALRDDPEVGKLGVIGFCWGGRHAVIAGSGANPLADAVVSNHPALLAIPAEIEAISRPVQINTGDVDPFFEAPAREQVREILSKKTDVPTEFNVIAGAVHGYSVRGDMQDPEERARKERTTTDAINWFTKYLS